MNVFENHGLKNAVLPFIFKESKTGQRKPARHGANWHENLEIVIVDEGEGFVSDNGRMISVRCGDVAVFNHNHLHAIYSAEGILSYRYLIADRSFCLENGFDTSELFFSPSLRDERFIELFSELSEAWRIPEEDRLRTLKIRCAVLKIMTILCGEYSAPIEKSEAKEGSEAYVKLAIEYILASYDKDFSLDDAAEFVGVTRCYLSREFHKYTGETFVSFVNNTRCKMAKKLLAEGEMTTSEVAAACGFRNRSYFAKCFKRFVGALPGEYRKK